MGNFNNCFIQKNTTELINKLIDLGYIAYAIYSDEPNLYITTFNLKFQSSTEEDKVRPIVASIKTCDDLPENFINCGTDETLFLTIAQNNIEYVQ